jgi:hypothetical protein
MRRQNRDKVLTRFFRKVKRELFTYVKVEKDYLVEGEDYIVYSNSYILGIIPAEWTPETAETRDISKTAYTFPKYTKVIPEYKNPIYNTEYVNYSLVSTLRKRGDKFIYLWFGENEICLKLDDLYHIMQMTQEEYLRIEAEENEPLKAVTIRENGAVYIVSPCRYDKAKRERKRANGENVAMSA